MPDRFYAPNLMPGSGVHVLDGAEAHHLLHVLRATVGLQVELFDGRGTRVAARVARVAKREVELALLDSVVTPAPPPLVLACAIPKGDRAQWLVEKCVELGVTTLIPLVTARSVVHPHIGKRDKWNRIGIEACKQCRRDFLLVIESPTPWIELVSSRGGWMLHADAESHRPDRGSRPGTIAIGPEGGWTSEEVQLARDAGWQLVHLPGHTLRVETAALAAATIAQFGWARP